MRHGTPGVLQGLQVARSGPGPCPGNFLGPAVYIPGVNAHSLVDPIQRPLTMLSLRYLKCRA